ncbi:MAG: tripartite tricarboxylate transporter substrate binding protein [Deltaproteobacteria bacterium]|nr:MAG: tripartite tricarboxylate transporter substrate binding protein [Deltaproteobacteria bacterium]
MKPEKASRINGLRTNNLRGVAPDAPDMQKKESAMRKKGLFFSTIVIFSLFVIAAAFAPSAQAAYPEEGKVIEFLHHSSPGGGAGLFVLTCADLLNKTGIVKNKIQVQTRQGGSSAVALNYLNSKAGDPYVVMMWTTAQLNALNRGTTQLKIQDITWLTTLVEDGNVMIVPYKSPYKTAKDLIADAKTSPTKVSVGINSIGGSEHIMAARIERVAGLRFNITAFEFSPTQLIGGHIDMAFGNTSETSGHVKAKRARCIANMGEKRLPYYKDVPTLAEQGTNASFTQFRGFIGAPNFPSEAVKFWDDAFAKLMKTKEFNEYMKKADYVGAFKNSTETKSFVQGYNAELIKDAKYIEENK